jgi:hypothetical protein
MTSAIFRYEFPPTVSMAEVEEAIVLAVLAAQGVHGEALVRLEARHYLDGAARKCIVDARTEVGATFNQIFVSFLLREFGNDGFRVERVLKDVGGLSSSTSSLPPIGSN